MADVLSQKDRAFVTVGLVLPVLFATSPQLIEVDRPIPAAIYPILTWLLDDIKEQFKKQQAQLQDSDETAPLGVGHLALMQLINKLLWAPEHVFTSFTQGLFSFADLEELASVLDQFFESAPPYAMMPPNQIAFMETKFHSYSKEVEYPCLN